MALLFVLNCVPVTLAETVVGQYEIPLSQATTPESAVNACLASWYINGTIVNPGEVFSFNQTVGERLPERLFVMAPIASRSKYKVYDYGGGICMTAGILHQAVINSGLQVMERHNHVTAVNYLPTGQDAAVTWGVQDYRFRNTSVNPVRIHVETYDSVLRIQLIQASY